MKKLPLVRLDIILHVTAQVQARHELHVAKTSAATILSSLIVPSSLAHAYITLHRNIDLFSSSSCSFHIYCQRPQYTLDLEQIIYQSLVRIPEQTENVDCLS